MQAWRGYQKKTVNDVSSEPEQVIEKRNLIVDTSGSKRSQYHDNFLINVNVWDADINPNALMRVSNDGRLADVPVKVILTKPNGENLVTMEDETDSFGKFEGKYRWAYRDLLGDYNVLVDVDNGNYVKAFSTFYDGFIQPDSDRPTANAGPDQSVVHLATVQLDGSASTGIGTLSFSWTELTSTGIVLSDPNIVNPTFDTLGAGDTYTLQLTVTDANGKTDTDTVTITT